MSFARLKYGDEREIEAAKKASPLRLFAVASTETPAYQRHRSAWTQKVNVRNPDIALLDSPQDYGRISRIVHGLGGLLTLILFGLGFSAWLLVEGAGHHRVAAWHMALGGLLALPLLLRVGWRLALLAGGRSPHPLAPAGWRRYAERAVHLGLLTMLTLLVVSGPLLRWWSGNTISVFGWFEIPSPLGDDEHLSAYAWAVHHRAWQLMAVLLAVHVLGALLHGRSAWLTMRWFARRMAIGKETTRTRWMSGFVYRKLKGFGTRTMRSWSRLVIKGRTVSVRELQPGDEAWVHNTFRSFGAQPLAADLPGLAAGKIGIVVAWLGASPIGIGFVHWDGPRNAKVQQRFPDVPEIYRLWVRPHYRAAGLGSQLVHHIESLALVRGQGRIGLGVHEGNRRAHALYLRLGYQPDLQTYVDSYPEREPDGHSRQVNQSAIFMVKTLGGSNKP